MAEYSGTTIGKTYLESISTIGTKDIKTFDTEKLLQEIVKQGNNKNEKVFVILEELLLRIETYPISVENIYLLVHAISDVCSTSSPRSRSNQQKLLQTFVDNEKLKTKLQLCLINISETRIDDALIFLGGLMNILSYLCEILPTYSLECVVVLLTLISKLIEDDKEYSSLKEKVDHLQEKQNEIIKSVKDNTIKVRKIREPPNNFRSISVEPKSSDILLDAHPFLRKNVLYGAYQDTEHYLDVQFRLLREDFILPMRTAIAQYKQEITDGKLLPYLQDARLYTDVHILGMVCQNDGIARKVQFDMSRFSRVNWDKSRRLMNGSLVCVSRDNFRSLAFGVVNERNSEELSRGIVYVKFDENTLELIGANPFEKYVMIESVAYYESYKHNLLALQEIKDHNMPMKKYILNQRTEEQNVEEPVFLRSDKTVKYDMSCMTGNNIIVDVLDTDNWPTAAEMGMDESQCSAMKSALTKEFSIIQGPPGTGKTYLGLKLLQVLLNNKKVWSPDSTPSILIACYTNHALDQFLNGILDMFPEMVSNDTLIRIGGHTNLEDRIMNCKLNKKIQSKRSLNQLKTEQEQIGEQIGKISELLSVVNRAVVQDKDMELIIGYHSLTALKSKYKHFSEFLQCQSILVLWLSMADKTNYKTLKYSQKQKVESQKVKNDHLNTEDNNEDLLRIMSDEKETFQRKDKRYSSGFTELEVTYDDIVANNCKSHIQKLQTYLPQFREIMLNQLTRNECMSIKEAQSVPSTILWQMIESQRWKLYRRWVLQYYTMKCNSIKDLCRKYEQSVELLYHERSLYEVNVLKRAHVIGITTTGAAKYRDLISAVKPRIFVIEEAAEILEAHIITTLTNSCEQLILIGDHQQLRPNPASYTLAKNFKLDISLFERMVKTNMHLNRLSVQHRMRPEISSLLVPHIYEELKDHASVFGYPDIKGVKGNIYFLNHDEYESQDEESRSHSNLHEANFVVGFCRYLIRQGYMADEMTVLTTYKGQQFLIKELMHESEMYLVEKEEKKRPNNLDELSKMEKDNRKHIRIVTVDNFQGEENKIIILSLVRSNDKDSIGFLKMSNRICVALSRAKHGFFVIGNMKQLAKNSKTWKNILADEKAKTLVIDSIPLVCQNHPETEVNVRTIEDFQQVPEGGCTLKCEYRLVCGHVCTLQCHPYDQSHDTFTCQKPCAKTCPNGHPCKQKCYEMCKLCNVPVEREMSKCGHLQIMQCWYDKDTFSCQRKCEKSLSCGHNCQNTCGRECTIKCGIHIPIMLDCEHTILKKCHIDIANVKCNIEVTKTLPCCHTKLVKCHEDPAKVNCEVMTQINTCKEHVLEVECQSVEQRMTQPCSMMVTVICPLNPNHADQIQCCEKKNALCSIQCDMKLECGHNCTEKCGNCYTTKSHNKCQSECGEMLPCGHKCRGPCNICKSTKQHQLCCQQVWKKLHCGDKHYSRSYCNLLPTKCSKPCESLCQHRKCYKQCGDSCDICRKVCSWQCPHYQCNRLCFEPCDRRCCNQQCQERLRCGHKCQGYCGEPCLQVCYECQKTQFIDVARALGYRITRPWGFVLLQPCNHIIQGFFMDYYVKNNVEYMNKNRFVEYLKCPYCHTAIRFCPRYSNDIKIIERRMENVKALQNIESKRHEYLFKSINSEDRSMILAWQYPSRKDLLRLGILCMLQASFISIDCLENKLDKNTNSCDTGKVRRNTNVIDLYCDVTKEEIGKARKGVTEMIDSCDERKGLETLLMLSLETFLRCKVADLDFFIHHQVKRDQLRKMVTKLQDHEEDRLDGTVHGITILKDVVYILEDNFTLKQRDNIESLMGLLEQFFKPVPLVPTATGSHTQYAWVYCRNQKIHYLPRNHRVTKDISIYKEGVCIACESEDTGKDIFQEAIDNYTIMNNGNECYVIFIDDDDNNEYLQKRHSFLEIYRQPMEQINTEHESAAGHEILNKTDEPNLRAQSTRGRRQRRGRGGSRIMLGETRDSQTTSSNQRNVNSVESVGFIFAGSRGRRPRRWRNPAGRK